MQHDAISVWSLLGGLQVKRFTISLKEESEKFCHGVVSGTVNNKDQNKRYSQ